MNKMMRTGLFAAVLFQFVVLTGMYVKAAIPLWTGQEIKVKTVPVDPRSLFRGNYARLRYEFSEIDARELKSEAELDVGDIVYVSLKLNRLKLYEFSGASLETPQNSIFLRGRISNTRFTRPRSDSDGSDIEHYAINYGLDAFFAPKEKALALERDLREGGIAVLMVASDGRARIKSINPP